MTTPDLDERRIDAMRSSIMNAVDADVARRGRRVRRGLGALAAACFVVVIGGVGFSQLPNPDAGSNDSAGGSTAPSTSSRAGSDTALQEDSAGKKAAPVAPRDVREVITTGSVDVTVDDPRDVAKRFSDWVEASSGRVDGRTESKDGDGRTSASLTVRVPSGQMSKALAKLATYGDVGTVDVQNDDVTAQGQDLDARIKALEISIDRLEKILSEADVEQRRRQRRGRPDPAPGAAREPAGPAQVAHRPGRAVDPQRRADPEGLGLVGLPRRLQGRPHEGMGRPRRHRQRHRVARRRAAAVARRGSARVGRLVAGATWTHGRATPSLITRGSRPPRLGECPGTPARDRG